MTWGLFIVMGIAWLIGAVTGYNAAKVRSMSINSDCFKKDDE